MNQEKAALKPLTQNERGQLEQRYQDLYNAPPDQNYTISQLKKKILQQFERDTIDLFMQSQITEKTDKEKRKELEYANKQQPPKRRPAQSPLQNADPNQPVVDPNGIVGIGFKKSNTW